MALRARLVALLAPAALAAAPAAAPAAPAQLPVVGGVTFAPGRYVLDDQRFGPLRGTLRPGGGLSVRNRTFEAHTLTLVRRNQLPRSFDCPVCDLLGEVHELYEEGPPRRVVVDGGARGLDAPGDSFYLRGGGTPRRPVSRYIRVSAPRGSTLNLLCIIHPWMQTRLRVR